MCCTFCCHFIPNLKKKTSRQVIFLFLHLLFSSQIPALLVTTQKYRSRTPLSVWVPIQTWLWLTSPVKATKPLSVEVKNTSSKICLDLKTLCSPSSKPHFNRQHLPVWKAENTTVIDSKLYPSFRLRNHDSWISDAGLFVLCSYGA